MFAYALIAAELLLFSLVFYLVFVKEPKRFEVKENLWGYYGAPEDKESAYLKPFMASFDSAIELPKTKKRSKRQKMNHQLKRMVKRTRHGVQGLSRDAKTDLKNGWNYLGEEKSSKTVGTFLSYLGQLLTSLSAKLS